MLSEVYESTFLPFGVSANAFAQLMKSSARRRKDSGAMLVQGGVPFRKARKASNRMDE